MDLCGICSLKLQSGAVFFLESGRGKVRSKSTHEFLHTVFLRIVASFKSFRVQVHSACTSVVVRCGIRNVKLLRTSPFGECTFLTRCGLHIVRVPGTRTLGVLAHGPMRYYYVVDAVDR